MVFISLKYFTYSEGRLSLAGMTCKVQLKSLLTETYISMCSAPLKTVKERKINTVFEQMTH